MPDSDNGGTPGSWSEYKRLVMESLKRMEAQLMVLRESQEELRREIAMLKVKSGLWGASAGFIPVMLYALWKFMEHQ